MTTKLASCRLFFFSVLNRWTGWASMEIHTNKEVPLTISRLISSHHARGNPQSPIPRLKPWSLCHPCRPLSMQSPASRRHQTDCPLTIGYCFLAILHQFPAAIILNSTQDYHWSQETDTARANNNHSPGSAANTRSILDSIWLCDISANPVFMRMYMIWEGWHSFWHFKSNDLTTKYTEISK